MAETSNKTTGQNSPKLLDSSSLTADLAKWTIIFAFGGITILGLSAILVAAAPGLTYLFGRQEATIADFKDGFSNIKDILGILLPVMSAWAGTVFAFYFSKENFKAGTDSSAALVSQFTSEQKLKSIPVRDVMIKIDQADKLVLDNEPKKIMLKTDIIEKILDAKKRERLPILDTGGHIKYMAHRSLIDKFIVKKAGEGQDVATLSLQDMLDDDTFGKILRGSYCVVPEAFNLGDGKNRMEKLENCSDIFVTADGDENSKVIGWVTDVIVRQNATV